MLLLLELDLNKPFKRRIENTGKQGVLLESVFKENNSQLVETCTGELLLILNLPQCLRA